MAKVPKTSNVNHLDITAILRRLLPPEELSLPTEIKAPPPSENASDRLAVGLAELRSRLENRVVERLTPIRYRYNGLLMDLTAQYDDQAIMRAETKASISLRRS